MENVCRSSEDDFVGLVKQDVKSVGLSQRDAQSRNKWRRRTNGIDNWLIQLHIQKWLLNW